MNKYLLTISIIYNHFPTCLKTFTELILLVT